jgi:NAD(P)-dependent dehydrogenase (short-subunit alcohol dehydrogenase family)
LVSLKGLNGVITRFHDKIAIVTGGASGIGKEVATRFVAEGGLVVINGRDRAKAEAAVREIDPKGRRAVVHVGDIALPATGEAVVKTAIDRFGRLDVLFNNAGMFTPKPFLQVDEVEYDRFVDVIQVITVSNSSSTASRSTHMGAAIFDSFRRIRTGFVCVQRKPGS